MQKRAYVGVTVGAFIAALVVSVLSLVADVQVGEGNLGLFQRSGGLVVLSAVVVEYQLWVKLYLRNAYKPGREWKLHDHQASSG